MKKTVLVLILLLILPVAYSFAKPYKGLEYSKASKSISYPPKFKKPREIKEPGISQEEHGKNLNLRALTLDNTSPILTNMSLTDFYVYHGNATSVIALRGGAGSSIILLTNSTIMFYNYTRSYVLEMRDYDYGYLSSDVNEVFVALGNGSVKLFSFDGEVIGGFNVSYRFDRVSITSGNITLWRFNSSSISTYSSNGSLLMSGNITELRDIDGAEISYSGSVSVRDLFFWKSRIIVLLRYNLGGVLTDSIGTLNYAMGSNQNITVTIIDNEPPMTIYGYAKGLWRGGEALFVLMKNKTKGLEARIYAGLRGKNDSIAIDPIYTQLISNSIDLDALSDWNGDGVSEIAVSNASHVGVIISNGTVKEIPFSNGGVEGFGGQSLATFNESSILILNQGMSIDQRYDVSRGYLVDLFNISSKLVGVSNNGSIIFIDPLKRTGAERIITSFNFKGFSYSLNAIATYTSNEVLADWVGETRYILHYLSSEVDKAYITNNTLMVVLTNGSKILYNRAGSLIYKTNDPDVSLATAKPDASQVFVALSNGTLVEVNSGERSSLATTNPASLNLFNNTLVYLTYDIEDGPLINVTLLKVDASTLSINKSFTVMLDLSGLPSSGLSYYDYLIAYNDINDNGIPDLAIGAYGEVITGTLSKNVLNISIIRDLNESLSNYCAESYGSTLGFRYKVFPFNNSFLYINSSSDYFYLLRDDGSVVKLVFAGEKALSATNHILFTNETIRIYYNGKLYYNLTTMQRTMIGASLIKDRRLIAEFLDTLHAIRMRRLSGTEDYYAPSLTDIRSPKILSESTLIADSSSILFDLSFSDDVGLRNYTIKIDSVSYTAELSGTMNDSKINISTGLTDGKYVLEIAVRDLAGRESINSYYLIIDSTPPLIDYKCNKIYNTTFISFEVNVSDVNFDHMDIYLDNQYYSRYTVNQVLINISDLYQGKHSVDIFAIDKAGNSRSENFSFIVDVEEPNIVVYYPENETYTNQDKLNVSVKLSDNYNLSGVKIYLNKTMLLEKELDESNKWINLSIGLKLGVNLIMINVVDQAFHRNTSAIIVYMDTEKPELSISDVKMGDNEYRLIINASDNFVVRNITIYIDGKILATYNVGSVEISLSLNEGIHNVTAVAIDAAENIARKELNIIVDNTPPEITVLSPKNHTISNLTHQSLNLNISDNLDVSYTLIYLDANLVSNTTDLIINYQFNLTDGDHVILVTTRDIAGNNESVIIELTIDTRPPTIEIISPKNSTLISKDNLTLKISYLDNLGISRIIVTVNDSIIYNVTTLETEFNITFPTEGRYRIKVTVIDVAGNKGYEAVWVEVSFNKPAQPSSGQLSYLDLISASLIGVFGVALGIIYVYYREKFIRVR